MSGQATSESAPWRFGGPNGADPREAGRAGGRASQLSRRLRAQRQLEERIAATKNGAAIFGLYRTQLERDQALNRERVKADRHVMELDMLADGLRETIKDLDREVDERRLEVAALEARRLALSSIDDTTLITLLRDAGEEMTERALREIGWLDESDVDAA
jgi:hypothetical protein